MNNYELILLFDANLGEDKIDAVLARVEEKTKGQGGAIDKIEKWGTKRLASMIKKAKGLTQGYYVLVRFHGPSSLQAELRSYLHVTEHVVRYFISRAVEIEAAAVETKEISGTPLEAAETGE